MLEKCFKSCRNPVRCITPKLPLYAEYFVCVCVCLQALLPAAGLLQLNEVKKACCEFLSSQLHPSNCLGIRAFADLHACSQLLTQANSYAGLCVQSSVFIYVCVNSFFGSIKVDLCVCVLEDVGQRKRQNENRCN